MKRQRWDLEMLKEAASFKRSGMSWGEIAEKYGYEAKDLTSAVYRNVAKGKIPSIVSNPESEAQAQSALPKGRAPSDTGYILMPIRQDQIPSFIDNFYR